MLVLAKRNTRLLIAIVGTFAAGCLFLHAVRQQMPEKEPAALSSFITETIESHLTASNGIGSAIAVARNGAIVYERGFGVRRVGGPPVDVGTRFEIGSDTKQFTAAAILQLKELGKLYLDDHLSKYVPGFPHAQEITLRQLLNQTSGLPDFVMTNHFVHFAPKSPGSFIRIERLASGPLHFAPGSRWEYSNTNYIALGKVIELTSGEPYRHYIREHLFRAAAMQHSGFIQDEDSMQDRAFGYWWGTEKGPLQPAPNIGESWTWSAGDVVSTVGDLIKWDEALKHGKIISKADFDALTTPATLTDGQRDDYGFGWWVDNVAGHKHIYHDGDTLGMSSSNNLYPDDDLDIVVLENEGRDAAAATAKQVFMAILSRIDKPLPSSRR